MYACVVLCMYATLHVELRIGSCLISETDIHVLPRLPQLILLSLPPE